MLRVSTVLEEGHDENSFCDLSGGIPLRILRENISSWDAKAAVWYKQCLTEVGQAKMLPPLAWEELYTCPACNDSDIC